MGVLNPESFISDLYTRSLSTYDDVLKGRAINSWSNNMRVFSETAQSLLGDPVDIANYMNKYRAFIKVGSSNAVVTINGERHTLIANGTYCADPSEVQLMLEQSFTQSLGLTLATFTDYQATGVVESFYS